MSNLSAIKELEDYRSLLELIEVTEKTLHALRHTLEHIQKSAPDIEKSQTLEQWIEQEERELEFLKAMKSIEDKLLNQA